MTRKLAEASAGERPGLAAAFAALARGDSLAAEDAFEREYEAQSRAADEARQTMAEAARNVANLALLRDVAKAVSFYRKALAVEPEHVETARLLGHALMLLGDLTGARSSVVPVTSRRPIAREDSWGEMAAQVGLGDVFQKTKDLAAANRAFTAALGLAERRLAHDPANTEWQRDLSVSHDRIGDVLVAQGDGPGALAAYRKGLAIREALAARDPANTEWQRDLSVSHNKIGDVLVAQGDGPGALAAYRKGLGDRARRWPRAIRPTPSGSATSRSATTRSATCWWRRATGRGRWRRIARGWRSREALAARDPANTEWQRDLSVSHDRIGDVLVAQGDGPGALAAYRKGLGDPRGAGRARSGQHAVADRRGRFVRQAWDAGARAERRRTP